MWERKEIKIKAKEKLKNNYWIAVIVCFILAICTGEFGTSTSAIWKDRYAIDPNYITNITNKIEQQPKNENMQIEEKDNDFTQYTIIDRNLSNIQKKVIDIVISNVDNATKPQKYIVRIYDAIEALLNNKYLLSIWIFFGAIIGFLFTVFIADPLIVGGRMFFLKSRERKDVKVKEIIRVFEKSNWKSIVRTMFLRNIYNALWYLTIIGGVIKTYEYRMIPFILAENPTIDSKEAFKISKQLMNNNKWKTFILDLSFLGWNILSVLTVGIVGILYLNPYSTATNTELYIKLRDKSKGNINGDIQLPVND